ncbi:kinase dsk1 [Nannizzia gypsea CBS 118893]|uniref:Kinase dsk1 n=1 Tax=Arthroderma gypseum (strain ATCC MYA-4604 / CBS 118893) TaxID=535722 RepID=E4V6A2_ARTGP|nr:kinase dsk1 [Nannizzia gypsea CBS 118893]EFR05285.1 kinase dsk1 [Nannizzia gypsea CBS 118893]
MPGGVEHLEDIQPRYLSRSGSDSRGPMDIWNIFEGGSLFSGQDPESQSYRGRAHLAEMIQLLGPPPPDFVAKGNLSEFCADVAVGDRIPLEKRETTLEGQDKASFLRLMEKMLQWDPAKRSSAKELLEDEWISTSSIRYGRRGLGCTFS